MTTPRRLALAVAAVLLCAGPLTGCTGPPEAVTVTVLASWETEEGSAFRAALDAFTERTGVRVVYEGTRDVSHVLRSRLDRGSPPDLAVLPRLNDLRAHVRDGALRPLDGVPDLVNVAGHEPHLIRIDDRVYGVSIAAHVKSLLWYAPGQGLERDPPRTWRALVDRTAALRRAGAVPWCLGMSSPPLSGWPGTDWIEDLVLHRAGAAAYTRWVAGELPWTRGPVRDAWVAWGEVVRAGPPPAAALLTGYDDAGRAMFDQPPGCLLDHQGSFNARTYRAAAAARGLDPQRSVGFHPFPADAPDSGTLIAEDVLGMFRDTAAARRLVTFLTSERQPGQRVWHEASGGTHLTLGRGARLHPDADGHLGRVERMLRTGTLCRDASDLMPPAMTEAFQRATMRYLHQPERLDALLAGLEAVRRQIPAGEWLALPCVDTTS
ncbi:MAG TPA: ABC transporter substrate-binding protein [Pilimelia sp.]|nr:ABC transporter substrate-binding protein [Pilimelia sp.]